MSSDKQNMVIIPDLQIPEGYEFVRLSNYVRDGEILLLPSGNLLSDGGMGGVLRSFYVIVRKIPEPLIFPKELNCIECVGIAMDSGNNWHAYKQKPQLGNSEWYADISQNLDPLWFPSTKTLTQMLLKNKQTWKESWIPKLQGEKLQ